MKDIWNEIEKDNIDHSEALVGMKGKVAGESGIMTVDRYGNLVNITNNTIVEVSDEKDNPYNNLSTMNCMAKDENIIEEFPNPNIIY